MFVTAREESQIGEKENLGWEQRKLLVRVETEGEIWTDPFIVNSLCLVEDDLLFALIEAGSLVILEVEIKLGVTSWVEADRGGNSMETNQLVNVRYYSRCF